MKKSTKRHPHIKSYTSRGIQFWRVSFQLDGNQVRKQNFSSYVNAEEYYNKSRSQIRSGIWGSLSANQMSKWTVDQMASRYFKTTGCARAPATNTNARWAWSKHISPLIGRYMVRSISRKVLKEFVDRLRERGLSDNTISVIKAELINVLRAGIDYEVIEFLPIFPRLKREPKKKDIASPAEVIRIASAAPTAQYRDMILCQFALAARLGELLALTPSKFDLEEGSVLLDSQKIRSKRGQSAWTIGPTKTRTAVRLPLSDSFISMIRPYVEDRDPNSPLWISDRLRPVSRNGYANMLAKAVLKSGVGKHITSHGLRASRLDYLLNSTNLNVQSVAAFARHDVKVLVSRYTQVHMQSLFAFFQGTKPVALIQNGNELAAFDFDLG